MKIFIDHTLPNCLVSRIDNLLEAGETLVVDENIVDSFFNNSPAYAEAYLKKGQIVFEAEKSFDELVAEPFYWFTRKILTKPSDSFKEAIAELSDCEKIEELAKMLDANKSIWTPSGVQLPPLTIEAGERLGLQDSSSRSKIYERALALNKLSIFEVHNHVVISTLAERHHVDAFMCADGKLELV